MFRHPLVSSVPDPEDSSPATLLVVDDDLVAQARLRAYFSQEGFRVCTAGDGERMWRELEREPVGLVLLDVNLPGRDGISLARDLRARDAAIGIVLVTSRSDDIDKIVGLEVGADDYVTKPFNPRELLARVKSLLRRAGAARGRTARTYRFGGWLVDLQHRRLLDEAGRDVALTRGEFEILALLVRNAGAVVSRDRLTRAVNGKDWNPLDRTVDVLVRRLRAKLDVPGAAPSISTVRGEGYRLASDPAAGSAG